MKTWIRIIILLSLVALGLVMLIQSASADGNIFFSKNLGAVEILPHPYVDVHYWDSTWVLASSPLEAGDRVGAGVIEVTNPVDTQRCFSMALRAGLESGFTMKVWGRTVSESVLLTASDQPVYTTGPICLGALERKNFNVSVGTLYSASPVKLDKLHMDFLEAEPPGTGGTGEK